MENIGKRSPTLGELSMLSKSGDDATKQGKTEKLSEPPLGLGRLDRVRFYLNQEIARGVHHVNRQIVLAYFQTLEPESDDVLDSDLPPLQPVGMKEEIEMIFEQFPHAVRKQLQHELSSRSP